jgi:hypothetical protein
MKHSDRYIEAQEAVDELADTLNSTDNPSDESISRMVKGIGRVFLGMWHELHRIANALEEKRDE